MTDKDSLEAELPLDPAGTQLRRAREAKGLSRADIAAHTKIAERHLTAIEENRFSDLAGSTYAVGFARAYARAVGMDEQQIAASVRESLEAAGRPETRAAPGFEPGDPARVPSSGLAWIAALGALVVIALVWFLWPSHYSPAVDLPDLTGEPAPVAEATALAVPAARSIPAGGAVVFTATAPSVWVKFYDSTGMQLMQKEMVQGESWQVPAGAANPMIRTARPDALAITVGGRPVPPLADRQLTIRDVPVSAPALLARPQAAPVPRPAQTESGQTSTVSE